MTTAILVVETVVLVLLTVLVAGLLRSHAEILRRLHELGAGLDDRRRRPIPCGARSTCAPTTSDAFVAAADLDGAGLRDDALHVVGRRRPSSHAARVPLERLPHVSRVLGGVRRRAAASISPTTSGSSSSPRTRRRRASPRCASSRRRDVAGGDVERGLDRLPRSGLAVLRARRRPRGSGARRGNRRATGSR